MSIQHSRNDTGVIAHYVYLHTCELPKGEGAEVSVSNFGLCFLGKFTKSPKATISFVMYVPPSVRKEQLGSHWTDFHEI